MACNRDILDVLKAIIPDDVYIVVGEANPSVNGGVAVQPDDISFTVDTFVGWQGRLLRNGFRQSNKDAGVGDTYFNYTSITGEYTLSSAAQSGDVFICEAYKPA